MLLEYLETVVLFRSSPSQKADVVRYIRKYVKGSFTLAIGDGANDVNMIQAGHVGIGIMGKEDNQAASFSDYAIPQFKDLRTLLFNHGRSFGVRAGNYLSYCIYKSVLFSIPFIFFNCQNGFSGITYFDDWFYVVYDIINNEWPLFFYTLYEQDVSYSKPHVQVASYYAHCRDFILTKNLHNYYSWLGYAFFSGAVMYFIPSIVYGNDSIIAEDGGVDGLWTTGVICFTCLIIVHHIMITISTKNFTWFIITIYIGSFILYFPLTVWLNDSTPEAHNYKNIFNDQFGQWQFWLCILLCSTIIVLPYLAKNAIWEIFFKKH